MKRIVRPAWFESDRLRAIRSILEHYYETESGGLEAMTLKAIWYCVTKEPEELNRLASDELKNYVELNDN